MPSFLSVRQRYAERNCSTAVRRTLHVQRSANLIGSFAHSLKSEVSLFGQSRVSCMKPAAVVGDRHREFMWMIAQTNRNTGRSGVTDYVSKRLLYDPEHFVFDRGSEGPVNAPDVYIGFQVLGRILFHETCESHWQC